MGSEVRVRLSEDGADAERLASLTGFLRQDLLQLDVQDVTALRAGEPPPGARAIDVAAVGGLLVSLSGSAEALRAVVAAVRKWLTRGDGSPPHGAAGDWRRRAGAVRGDARPTRTG